MGRFFTISHSTSPQYSPRETHHLSIALRKGMCTCTHHPISQFVSYDHLSLSFCTFALSVASDSIPQSSIEAAQVPMWKAAIDAEVAMLKV